MTDLISDLTRRMENAAAALDFEEAKRLRDKLNLLRGGATASEAEEADTAGLARSSRVRWVSAPASSGSIRPLAGSLLLSRNPSRAVALHDAGGRSAPLQCSRMKRALEWPGGRLMQGRWFDSAPLVLKSFTRRMSAAARTDAQVADHGYIKLTKP